MDVVADGQTQILTLPTTAVSGEGDYAFALTSPSTGVAQFTSGEGKGDYEPVLEITTDSVPPPTNTTAPTVAGTPRVGETLLADPGSWTGTDPVTYDYQWRRCDASGANCFDITNATDPTYVLTSNDQGNTVRIRITANDPDGSTTLASAVTGIIGAAQASAPSVLSAPTVDGAGQENEDLTVSDGIWSGSTPFEVAYEWRRCPGGSDCFAIPGATDDTYTLTSTDIGATIRVRVTATNATGSTTYTTPDTAVIVADPDTLPQNTTPPQIAGTAQVGQTLTADPGTWSGSDAFDYSYEWDRCDSTLTICTAILGAETGEYTLALDDAGSRLEVLVTAFDDAGSSVASSSATDAVASGTALPTNTALPTITGTDTVGSTLTASLGTWSDATTYTYQWERCDPTCEALDGATSATYAVDPNDDGATIRVEVSATNSSGTTTAVADDTDYIGSPGVQCCRLHTKGRMIVNGTDTQVPLYGAVVLQDSDNWRNTDVDRMVSAGFTLARVTVDWAKYEPSIPTRVQGGNGTLNHHWADQANGYIDKLSQRIHALTAKDIFVILDVQKSGWSPAWPKNGHPEPGLPTWLYPNATKNQEGEARFDFWNDKNFGSFDLGNQPNNQGPWLPWDLYSAFTHDLVKRFQSDHHVVGLDIMNEPGWPATNPPQGLRQPTGNDLLDFYRQIVDDITNSNDIDAGLKANYLWIYENGTYTNATTQPPRLPLTRKTGGLGRPNAVLSWHFYPTGTEPRIQLVHDEQTLAQTFGDPFYLGEFDAFREMRINEHKRTFPNWKQLTEQLVNDELRHDPADPSIHDPWTVWALETGASTALLDKTGHFMNPDVITALQTGEWGHEH